MKTRKTQDKQQLSPEAAEDLRAEIQELDEQRQTIQDRLNDLSSQLEGTDPEEIVAHEGGTGASREAEEWREKYYRALADFQNFQRRSVQNEAEARRQGKTSVVEQLITVADNFSLAMNVDPEQATAEQIYQGVSVIHAEMMRLMKALDVEEIRVEPNDEFNPGAHQAMMQVPSDDVQPGHVVMMLQSGYRMGDRVLRPAKVSVALPDESSSGAASDSPDETPEPEAHIIDEVREEDLEREE